MVIINPDYHVEPQLLLCNRVWEKYVGTQGAHLGISGDSKPDNHCENIISQPWFDESKVMIYPIAYKERLFHLTGNLDHLKCWMNLKQWVDRLQL